jgi:ABC-type sugar transport system substrate-binding protein
MNGKQLRLSLAIALVLVACKSERPATSDSAKARASGGAADNDITIALIAKSSTNPVFLAARTGAEAAAKELSVNGLKVSVSWLTPPQEDGQVQAQRILQAVNDGADGILISVSTTSKPETR